MFTKMKESKGFTLVELMIVVAIIGILAAVAVPYYQRYVAKSRLTSKVIPGVHAIETSMGTYYAVRGELPTQGIDRFDNDSDTTCFRLEHTPPAADDTRIAFHVTIDAEAAEGCHGLRQLDGDAFTAFAVVSGTGKLYWDYEGQLADELGL